MEKVARMLSNYLLEKEAITIEAYEICRYGLLTGMEMLVCFAMCFIISLYMEMLVECIILLLLFFSIRSFVGGLHINNFAGCLICSCMMVFFTLSAIKYWPVSLMTSMTISICELVLILVLKPVENVNRFVNEKEKKVFSHRVRQVVGIVFAVTVLFYILDLNKYLNTTSFTLGAIILSMYFGKLKNKIENAKR